MKRYLSFALAALSLSVITGFPIASSALQTAPPPAQTKPAKAAKPASAAATPDQIADAKSKGMVWVNLNTNVYHDKSDRYYGKTKNGQFMTEADAQKAGAHLAGAHGAKAKPAK